MEVQQSSWPESSMRCEGSGAGLTAVGLYGEFWHSFLSISHHHRLGSVEAGKYGGAIVRMNLFQQMGRWIIVSGRKFPLLLCASEVRVGPLVCLWRR
jgi:hypothetical protein